MSGDITETYYTARNIIVKNRFVKNPNRYYHEEFFDVLPTLEDLNVETQATSVTNDVPATGKISSKCGIIRTYSTNNLTFPPNTGREFKFKNNLINTNSLIVTNLQKVSSNINDKTTVHGNSALTIMTHSINEGSCKLRLFHSANETRSVHLPEQTYDISYIIDPHKSVNNNWSISGTNADDGSVNKAEGYFGTGLILSTKNSVNDQCIIHPRGINSLGNSKFITTLQASSNSSGKVLTVTGTIGDHFSDGDPIYNSNGSLIGIVGSVSGQNITFVDNIPFTVSSSEYLYSKPETTALSLNRTLTTNKEIEFECCLRTSSDVLYTGFWAGLKQTSTSSIGTDDHQAYFAFDPTGNTFTTTLTNKTFLHFVYSVKDSGASSATDYVTALGLNVTAETVYRLRIVIDSSRKIAIFVDTTDISGTNTVSSFDPKNHQQYSLTTTSGLTGTNTSTGTTKSAALTTDTVLKPFVGVQRLTGGSNASYIVVNHLKVSCNSN